MTDEIDTRAEALELLERYAQLPAAQTDQVNVTINLPDGMTDEQGTAFIASDPETQAAMNLSLWSPPVGGERAGIGPLVELIHQRVEQIIESDDLAGCETMLVTQAITLDVVGSNLLLRASTAKNLKVIDTYTKLGLRAQSQSRSNIEALATIKRPALRQTNIANGPQQVNNQLGKPKSESKLSAVESNPPLAALERIDRAEKPSRKSSGKHE